LIRRFLKVAFLVGLLLVGYFAVTFVQVVAASRRDRAGQAQAILVLGAAQYNGKPSPIFRARLDHAADLYDQGLAPVVVVTGGRQPGDTFTEASAASAYLQERGVPEDALRLEIDGTNSWESLAAVARFLREEGITDVLLVSSPYHALRIEHIAADVGLDGRSSPADTPESLAGTSGHMIRETLAVGVGRIIGYRRLVDLDHRVDRARTD
jgi:uncharacterized SAM-binding protein YcdF (DUF218 family)